jgi:hypothetical protein
MQHMNILYVSQRLPFPPDRGDRIATYHHIRGLSQRHRVTVASLLHSSAESAQRGELERAVHRVETHKQQAYIKAIGLLSCLRHSQPVTLGYF